MFERILVANRGEIACRVMRTAQAMGVEVVAVYSDADRGAAHVAMADRAVHIGGSAPSESYLKGEAIIAAALETGAEAIHPGYGFLSENPDFVEAVEAAGLVFIGPSADAIRAMGLKDAAKKLMEEAGVPVVPGYHGRNQDPEHLSGAADTIGYPVLIKAVAGGGGKGMRLVERAQDFGDALESARGEARTAFGNADVLIEKFVETPRHIEVQVFGDGTRAVHLFERDCSLQRRHQKVIEEAPAPGMTPEMRAAMGQAAVRAAEAIGYSGAGTVEFIVDGSDGLRPDRFWFMEMNTRLQVEHPVTEAITGVDLVEWQLRVAAGEALPLSQDRITCSGHAMEARIYAEDPDKGFLPGSGDITTLRFPEQSWARIDTGVEAGDRVSVHYDPMIAKLVVAGENRTVALARLKQALAESHVGGLTTNLGFLLQLAERPEIADASIDTGLLDRALDEILARDAGIPAEIPAAAAAWLLGAQERAAEQGDDSPWARPDGWRIGGREARWTDLEVGDQRFELECKGDRESGYRFEFDGQRHDVRIRQTSDAGCTLFIDGASRRVVIHAAGDRLEIVHDHRRWTVIRHRRFESVTSASQGSGRIVAPMPGKVIQLLVAEGDEVAEGQTLALMEAMKMELSIKAEIAGTVEAIGAAVGDLVEADIMLLDIEPAQ